jgi:hypothetical protein
MNNDSRNNLEESDHGLIEHLFLEGLRNLTKNPIRIADVTMRFPIGDFPDTSSKLYR